MQKSAKKIQAHESFINEWVVDRQRKPNSDFRELVQERFDKDNFRCTLSEDEQRRPSKIETIADWLKLGENVQNRQLQTWLSEKEDVQIEAEREI